MMYGWFQGEDIFHINFLLVHGTEATVGRKQPFSAKYVEILHVEDVTLCPVFLLMSVTLGNENEIILDMSLKQVKLTRPVEIR